MLFSLSESVFHNSLFIFATEAFSRFGLSLSITFVFWVTETGFEPTTTYFVKEDFSEFRLFYVHWAYGVCSLIEAIDYSYTTEEWEFQFPLQIRQTWFTLLYILIHTIHPIISLNICLFNVSRLMSWVKLFGSIKMIFVVFV